MSLLPVKQFLVFDFNSSHQITDFCILMVVVSRFDKEAELTGGKLMQDSKLFAKGYPSRLQVYPELAVGLKHPIQNKLNGWLHPPRDRNHLRQVC